ncbi:MAG: SpoIIE family protein phosphatase [Candidatus Riflebacteria bacterium]|nr:SpoIIE family protein phosphatase [Candidatus Riflebacteria bacterium]
MIQSEKTGLFFRYFLLFVVFGIFPVSVIFTTATLVEELEKNKTEREIQKKHDEFLFRLKSFDDDNYQVKKALERAIEKINSSKNDESARSILNCLSREFPNYFDLYFFDSDNFLIEALSAKRKPRRIMEKTFEIFRERLDSESLTTLQTGILRTVFNSDNGIEATQFEGEIKVLSDRKWESGIYWKADRSPEKRRIKGIIALLHLGHFRKNRAVLTVIDCFNKKFGASGDFKFSLFLPTENNKLNPPFAIDQREAQMSILSALAGFESNFRTNLGIGTLLVRESSGYLIAFSRIKSQFSSFSKVFLKLFLIAWLLFVLRYISTINTGFSLRIPVKLNLLFLFAVGIPTLVLLIGGYYSLKDRENILLANLEQDVARKLNQLDQRSVEQLGFLQSYIDRMINESKTIHNLENRLKKLQKLQSEEILEPILVLAGDENFAWEYYSQKEASAVGKRQRKVLRLLILELKRRLFPLANNSEKGSAEAVLAENVFASMMGGRSSFNFMDATLNIGKFVSVGFGKAMTYFCIDLLTDPKGNLEHLIYLGTNPKKIQNRYLKNNINKFRANLELPLRVGVLSNKLTIIDEIFHPSEREVIKKTALEAASANRAITKIHFFPDGETLIVAFPGQKLSDYTLVAVLPLKFLRDRIKTQWLDLLIVGSMVFLTIFVIGRLLTRQFLTPIAEIQFGINEISHRNFDFELPIHAQDELGEVSALMNQVLGGMKDLQIAKVVQDSLFPQKNLSQKDYSIYGKSRAMTDIGGDYFDYYLLGKSKLLGIVGDVSGHGVSAALVMGMAKGAFSLEDAGKISLSEHLGKFNRLMLGSLNRKKMMTMFIFCLDLDENKLEFINAGHNYPFLFRAATGETKMIGKGGFPLGVRLKSEYFPEKINFEVGDKLLLYTDGFIESLKTDKTQIGFPEALEWFNDFAHQQCSSEEIVEKLFQKFDLAIGFSTPGDDVSLICLTRGKAEMV